MGQPIPDRIANKPLLGIGLSLYYDAFLELQFDRNSSEHIPWTVIIQYADRNKFDDIQTENLIYFIRKLDDCYVKWLAKKRKGKDHGNLE